MVRRLAIAVGLILLPAAAFAEGKMPQMDFQNPLTAAQVWWMAAILVVLYFALSRWGLPEIGKVLEHRAGVIAADLEAARAAKAEADKAVAAVNAALRQARETAQAEIAKAVDAAKAKAFEEGKALDAKLNERLDYAEKTIAEARAQALAAIKPVAADTATTILQRLTGKAPDGPVMAGAIETAYAAREAA